MAIVKTGRMYEVSRRRFFLTTGGGSVGGAHRRGDGTHGAAPAAKVASSVPRTRA